MPSHRWRGQDVSAPLRGGRGGRERNDEPGFERVQTGDQSFDVTGAPRVIRDRRLGCGAASTRRLQREHDPNAASELGHHRFWQHAEFPAEGLVGDGDQLSDEQIAVACHSALSSSHAQPQQAGIFDETSGGGDHDGRGISGLGDEVGLKRDGRAQLARLGRTRGLKSTT